MKREDVSSPLAPSAAGGYSQAVVMSEAARTAFISGQVPVAPDGTTPEGFEAQARQVWANLDAQLAACGMSKDDLVKVTIFLADRSHAERNRAARAAYLGGRAPALTVIVTGIFDASWLLEIEAVAAA